MIAAHPLSPVRVRQPGLGPFPAPPFPTRQPPILATYNWWEDAQAQALVQGQAIILPANLTAMAADILAAIETWFTTDATLPLQFPGGYWLNRAQAKVLPYVVADGVERVSPGETSDDLPVDVTLTVYGAQEDTTVLLAKTLHARLMDATRPSFQWGGVEPGYEIATWDFTGILAATPSYFRGGIRIYSSSIQIRFWYNPFPTASGLP